MKTLAKTALPLGAASLLFAAVPAQAETKILFNYFVPPKHPLKVGIMDNWSKRVTEGSKGRITVSYPAKTLAPAPRQWKMVTSGIADATVMFNNFERKRLSLDQVGTLPFSITDASSTATALWRTHKKYFEAKNQYKGVKLLGYIMHGGGEFFSLKNPITSLADLKKMKMRVPPGDVAKALAKTGAAVVPTPGIKAFDVVSKGIVDGMIFPIGDVEKLKMTPYVKHLTKVPGKVYGSVFSLYMNRKVWDKLSKEDKAVVDAASGEKISMDSNNWGNFDIEAQEIFRKKGIGIHNASAEFTANLKKLWAYQDEAWIETANKAGVDGRAALDFYRAESQRIYKATRK